MAIFLWFYMEIFVNEFKMKIERNEKLKFMANIKRIFAHYEFLYTYITVNQWKLLKPKQSKKYGRVCCDVCSKGPSNRRIHPIQLRIFSSK